MKKQNNLGGLRKLFTGLLIFVVLILIVFVPLTIIGLLSMEGFTRSMSLMQLPIQILIGLTQGFIFLLLYIKIFQFCFGEISSKLERIAAALEEKNQDK